jgi:hypothetical protein
VVRYSEIVALAQSQRVENSYRLCGPTLDEPKLWTTPRMSVCSTWSPSTVAGPAYRGENHTLEAGISRVRPVLPTLSDSVSRTEFPGESVTADRDDVRGSPRSRRS